MVRNNKHLFEVDVPVTDLDNPEDNIDFSGASGINPLDEADSDINDLDYELLHPSSAGSLILRKIRDFFASNRSHDIETLEMRDLSTGSDNPTIFISNLEKRNGDSKIGRIYKAINMTMKSWLIILILFLCFATYKKLLNHKKSTGFQSNEFALLSNSTHSFKRTTIVVSLDGFHPHYISPNLTPALNDMLINDYGTPFMTPSFPSSTFPNHWTLVTGLYPSEHGVVGNTFFDPKLQKQFVNTDPNKGGLDPDFWRGGEPIWKTAFDQNVSSAIHMWPGSEVESIGINNGPLFVDKYNGSEVLSSKVQRIMTWLDAENVEDKPQLILAYVPTIDQYGHKFGIHGSELEEALSYVDDFIGTLIQQLQVRNLQDIVNLIVVSDHGMAPTSNKRILYLDDVVDIKKLEHIDGWPLFGLRPVQGVSVDQIYSEISQRLKNLEENVRKNYLLSKVEDLPSEWNFGGQNLTHKFDYRLAPIWLIPKVGYSITTRKQMQENKGEYFPKGVHGYNNTEVLMRAIFLGKGPYFENKLQRTESKKVKPFSNIEVYDLICDTLNIKPSPNNGTFSSQKGNSLFSMQNKLPMDWKDLLLYPGVEFPLKNLVKNATYDKLWRFLIPVAQEEITSSVAQDSLSLIISEEASKISLETLDLPKPTDFISQDLGTSSYIKETTSDAPKVDFWNSLHNILGDVEEDIENTLEDAGDAIDKFLEKIEDKVNGN